MSQDRLRIGLIGTGMVADTHALALQDLAEDIEVLGVFSRNAQRRAAFADKYAFPTATSPAELAGDPRLHAVIITTPPDQRTELVELFASNGKHILLEKPVERSTAAAEHIVDVCRRHDVRLGVVFQHRFREASLQLARLLGGGALGKLGAVTISVPWWREQAYYNEPGRGTLARDGGGVLLTQAIHTLDLVLSLAGPVREVQAMAGTTPFHTMECEDFASGALRFENGALGSLVATTAAYPGAAESVTMLCELGSAHLESGTLRVSWRDGRVETFGEQASTGGGADPMAFTHAWHTGTIADFATAVRKGREPAATGTAALAVHRLIDALLASSREGRTITLDTRQLDRTQPCDHSA